MVNRKRIPKPSASRVAGSAWLRFSGLCAVMGLLAACASSPKYRSGDPSLPEIDVLQLKENSDEALKLAQENKLELQTLAAKVGELETRVSSLGDEVTNLPVAKFDEVTQQMALMTQQLRGLEERLAKGSGSGAAKAAPLFSPGSPDTASAAPKPGSMAAEGGKTPTRNQASRKPPASDVEAQLYKRAFDLYYGRKYTQAIAMFAELLVKFPSSTYADNCHYWTGECHFAQGNFAKAATSFRKVFAFPETEKADDAQLKLGYCALRLGDRRLAAEEFKKVVSLYPDSEYTERAKEELAKLE